MMTRSPLQYPGGKARALSALLPYIPRERRVVSPFIGGGHLALALAFRRQPVRGYDALAPLVAFCQYALRDARGLAARVSEYMPITRDTFRRLQAALPDLRGAEQATVYFVLNRAAFCGMAQSGGTRSDADRRNRLVESGAKRLTRFVEPRLEVEQADFRDVLPAHPHDFLYLDPPYDVNPKLYGFRGDLHEGFDHEALAHLLRGRGDWVLSYNDTPMIRDLYAGCVFETVCWSYAMTKQGGKQKPSNEVVIRPEGSALVHAEQARLFA